MSGTEALKAVNIIPDVILLDVNMPDINGLEVCKLIRSHISCPIIFLTARTEEMDVINILHSSSVCEEVKGSSPVFGLIGLTAIPIGLILFNITAVIASLKSISILFLGISLIGIYLIAAQITSIGKMVACFFPSSYRKNILFYNLIRMKGNQYTLAFFVSSMLLALTIFLSVLTDAVFWKCITRSKKNLTTMLSC